MELTNNHVLITGGSRGIGCELAYQLLAKGNEVAITVRSQQDKRRLQDEHPSLRVYLCDVTSEQGLHQLKEQIHQEMPELNILINNAGVGQKLNFLDESQDKNLFLEMQTNLLAPIQLTELFLPILKKQKQAAIVNVSSALAFTPLFVTPLYSASKAGLHSFTMSLREQLKDSSIKVFELIPPSTQTDMLNGFHPEERKVMSSITVEKLVRETLLAIEKDQFEICPGPAKQMKFMSRVAPQMVLKKMRQTFSY